MRYDFGKIEKKWQDRWDEAGIFKATDDYSKPKFYGNIPQEKNGRLQCAFPDRI